MGSRASCWARHRQLPQRGDLPPAGNARPAVARAMRRVHRATTRRRPRRPRATLEPFNLVVPRSACPSCKAPITALQNIPLLSWLILGGRCANCGKPISVRYPLVEALTGVLTAAVAWKFGFGWPALSGMVLTWFLVALTFIDIDHQLLPDSLTLPLLWGGLLVSLWGASDRCHDVSAGCALEPDRSDGGLRKPVERLSSVPADSPAKKAWATVTSNCSPHSARGSAGRCCCRSF